MFLANLFPTTLKRRGAPAIRACSIGGDSAPASVTGLQRPMGFCDRVRTGAFLRGGCGQDGTERPVLCGFTAVCYRLCRRGLESDGQDIAELRDIAVRDFFCEGGVRQETRTEDKLSLRAALLGANHGK